MKASHSNPSFTIPLLALSIIVLMQMSDFRARAALNSSSLSSAEDTSAHELQTLLDAQRAATTSANTAAVIETSKKLSAYALLEMARMNATRGAWVKAVPLYRQSLLLEDRPEASSELVLALKNSERLTAAVPVPSKVSDRHLKIREHQLSQILGSSFNDWGTAEARQELDEKALSHFQEAERWDASLPGLMRNLGMVAFRAGKFAESARAFNVIIQADPTDATSRMFLAMSLFSLDRFADAAKTFAPISDVALRDPRTGYAMVYSLARSGQQARANEILDRLTAEDVPTEVLNLFCQIYNTTENYEHSVTCFRRVYSKAPSTPLAHYQVAVALIRLDRPTEALPELREEQKSNPNNPDVQYQLAYALLETSHKDEAVALLRQVLVEKPDHAQAQYELGKVLLENGEVSEAIQHLEIAARYDESKDYIHYQLQSAYRRAGRNEEAEHELTIYRTIKAKHREATPTSAH